MHTLPLSRRAALPLALVVVALAACSSGGGSDGGGDGGQAAARHRPAAATATTRAPATTAAPTTTAAPVTTAAPAPTPTTHAPAAPPSVRFVCPEGGMAELAPLQQSVDEGHQPWRLDATEVARSCAFGGTTDATVNALGGNRYRVTQTGTGKVAIVTLARPFGPRTMWVATSVR